VSARLSRAVFWLASFGALFASGCNAILGITDNPVVVTPGGRACLLKSDCNETEICLFAVCSPPCAANRDCDLTRGERCLKVAEGTACVSNGAAVCVPGGPACPAGTSCVGGKCLSDCGGDSGTCPSDQICASDNVCRGGEDAGVPGNDASADAPARECNPEGALRCEGNAQSARSICQDGKWAVTDSCADGTLCDTTASPAGTCKTVEPLCFGRKPGDSLCNGATRVVCGPDLVSAQTTQCPSAQHCTAVATGCAACLDNEYQCNTTNLMKCKSDHSGFELVKTCTTDQPCNAQAGDCTTHACSPMQKRCNGDRLELCNADQSAFALVATCGTGLCDSQTLMCDTCVARSTTCAAGMVRTCSADGQTQTDSACPAGMPFCTGNGVCVACTDASNCTPPNDCRSATCNAGTCGFPPKGMNIACNGGVCDGSGNCVECVSAGQCTGPGECFTAACGTDHKCTYTQKAPSVSCSIGYCNAAGVCVACLNDGHCTGTTPICSAQGTCVACGTNAQCTAKGVGLNYCRTQTGACVACLASANCSTATTPICDAASFTCRTCTQGTPPTTGDAECNARNGAAAPACKTGGSCVKCTATNTAQCSGSTPFCNTTSNLCVQCLTSADCSGTAPICTNNACAACTTNAQCTAKNIGLNICNAGRGDCVQCVADSDCGGANVCLANNTCCAPQALSITCGQSSCGMMPTNCGNLVSCGSCSGQQCCEVIAMPGVSQCMPVCP